MLASCQVPASYIGNLSSPCGISLQPFNIPNLPKVSEKEKKMEEEALTTFSKQIQLYWWVAALLRQNKGMDVVYIAWLDSSEKSHTECALSQAKGPHQNMAWREGQVTTHSTPDGTERHPPRQRKTFEGCFTRTQCKTIQSSSCEDIAQLSKEQSPQGLHNLPCIGPPRSGSPSYSSF